MPIFVSVPNLRVPSLIGADMAKLFVHSIAMIQLVVCAYAGEVSLGHSVASSTQAIARVEEYLGSDFVTGVSPEQQNPTVELLHGASEAVAVGHTSAPSTVWKVTYDSVYLDFANWPASVLQNQRVKTYHVLIDSATGQLIRVYSRVQTPDPELAPEPPAIDVEMEMRLRGEPILGLPPSPPPISFYEALKHAMGSKPLAAKEIEASCYIIKLHADTPIVVWSIIGRGIEFVELHPHPGLPKYKRNRGRSLINAVTGQLIFMDNFPRIKSQLDLDSALSSRSRDSADSKPPEHY